MRVLILTMPNCIKCKSIIPQLKDVFDRNHVSYEVSNALPDHRDLVKSFNILAVPAVVIYDGASHIESVFKGDFEPSSVYKYLGIVE